MIEIELETGDRGLTVRDSALVDRVDRLDSGSWRKPADYCGSPCSMRCSLRSAGRSL